MKNNALRVMVVVLSASLGACAGMQQGKLSEQDAGQLESLAARTPEPLQPLVKRLYHEGERNAVLNFNALGLAAMQAGEWELAARAFDQSIQRIETIYADNDQARKAKSNFAEERVKDFKGEPYERTMAYYYRGLLYLRAGDYQNARASFLSADYQDTVSEKETYSGDFALMPLLAGWSSFCDGDGTRGRDLVRAAVEKEPSLSGVSSGARFLAIVEAGLGPRKVGTGKHKEVLTFEESDDALDSGIRLTSQGVIVADNTQVRSDAPSGAPGAALSLTPAVKAADLHFQASTRGGRPVQGILNGKAQFKDNASTAGDVALATGTAVLAGGAFDGNSDMMGVGAAIQLLGLAAKIASDAAKPSADTRTWSSLPRDIYVTSSAAVPHEGAALQVEWDKGATPVVAWPQQGQCSVAWVRTRPVGDRTGPYETSAAPRDKAFRAGLFEILTPREASHEG